MDNEMQRPQNLPEALDDEDLSRQRAMVRGQLAGYLSGLWQYTSEELEAGKDAVRWAELQLRIIDRLAKIWRLDERVIADAVEESTGEEQERIRAMVALQLDDVEAKRISG